MVIICWITRKSVWRSVFAMSPAVPSGPACDPSHTKPTCDSGPSYTALSLLWRVYKRSGDGTPLQGHGLAELHSSCVWGGDFSEPCNDAGYRLCWWLCGPGWGAALGSGGWGCVRFCALEEGVTPSTRSGLMANGLVYWPHTRAGSYLDMSELSYLMFYSCIYWWLSPMEGKDN